MKILEYSIGDAFNQLINAIVYIARLIGAIEIMLLVFIAIVMFITFKGLRLIDSSINKYRQFRKELNELRDLKETTNNVEKPFSTMAKEVNKIREQEYNRARKDILEEELNSIEREEKPMTIEDICVDRDKEFIEHKHRGHKLSTDRENYPEVFQEMKDLYNKLVEEIGITRITKSTGINFKSLYSIKKDKIATLPTAQKYITLFNKVIEESEELEQEEIKVKLPTGYKRKATNIKKSNDREEYPEVFIELYRLVDLLVDRIGLESMAELTGKSVASMYGLHKRRNVATKNSANFYIEHFNRILKDLSEANKKQEIQEADAEDKRIIELYDLATEAERDELHRLIDIALENNTQAEIGLRMNIPQPAVSSIYSRKVIRRATVLDYTARLKKIVHLIANK